ncbi:asparagine synthase (glutamine-hydrolyzing) [Alicyclobacillus fastidiosus]|uniref:asparagine synthase (glutamine-hydrolyzing) n=1 Tax=Alicyclobacillus fastidiosus TaxID=392011 RepID=A0ABV5AE50_9BACL|nr:asparagine synthase (glutamine-hydrolyzing) [Alicyclobacillus fastidiosus]WEH09895.1 asparagine synthase (glutamine-hydrolyzing) [Alicyclobacillus fastidiosus]
MCGIAGWVDWSRDLSGELQTVKRMGETLYSRGPDTAGLWSHPHAVFAHRRLIVVDPDGGLQPMTRSFGDKAYTLVYNGELYNTEDIRKDLLAMGFKFQSYSDTEVVLVSYVAWGEACVEKFNGIFAFAIWDEFNQRLFMARDRLGVKPLFYSRIGNGVVFGSELKAILAHPSIDPVVKAEGLAEIFAIGPARTPGLGIYEGVEELRAGHVLIGTPDKISTHQYWKLRSYEHSDSLEKTIKTVRELMVDIVERQLISDVPIATFLSGGLDSSVVSAIAARYFQQQGRDALHTFAIEFKDMEKHFQANAFQKSLDGPWAQRISEHIGSIHHRVIFDTPDLAEHLLHPLATRDLPGMADIDTSLFLFCQEVKKDVTVALSGEAADEVFGGYPWFHREESLKADTFPWSLRLHERVNIMSDELKQLVQPQDYVQRRYAQALEEVPRLAGESARDARIREIGYLSITRFMPTLLDRKDRMSMGSGLEVRVPFCDHRLVEYVFNIPWEMKTVGNETKGILRKAMEGYLPEDALYRKKSPYPSTPNPDYLALVRDKALAMLDDKTSPIHPFVDENALRALAALSHNATEHRPWFGQIMGTAQMFHYLYETNEWLRQYHVTVR